MANRGDWVICRMDSHDGQHWRFEPRQRHKANGEIITDGMLCESCARLARTLNEIAIRNGRFWRIPFVDGPEVVNNTRSKDRK